jgi:hypothetical protein
MSTIITFPGSSERERAVAKPTPTAAEISPGEALYGPSRSRSAVQANIDAHIKARKDYGRAVAWEMAVLDGEGVRSQLEDAREHTLKAYEELQEAARHLLICMPTDAKALVDILLYLEKNFSTLPPEMVHGANTGQSLAFDLLRTVRLSLRAIAKYGKHDGRDQ